MKNVIALLLMLTPAAAHDQWADGSTVPPWVKAVCCGQADAHLLQGLGIDVFEQPCKESQGLCYRVEGYVPEIPHSRAEPSQDGHWWAFYGNSQSTLYCFFAPMNM